MSVKKSILSASALALAVTTVVGGTLAYNTAEDSDVNLQENGYVDIVQHEYQRADKTISSNNMGETPELVPFVQGQSLYPAYANYNAAKTDGYGSPWSAHQSDLMYWGDYVSGNSGVSEGAGNGLFEAKYLTGALDKFVFVENTGSSDCYFRTVIAFECPEGITIGDASVDDIGTNVNSGYTWGENNGEQFVYTEINGTRYAIIVGVYTGWNGGVLTPGETARPSLLQVAFSDKMTNDQSKLFGDTYEILVNTQACQTENLGDDPVAALNTVFGEITAESHPWTTTADAAVTKYTTAGTYTVNDNIIIDGGEADCIEANGEGVVVNITGGQYTTVTADCAVWATNGATVNISGGYFSCGDTKLAGVAEPYHSDLIYANAATINISGGFFTSEIENDWLVNMKDNSGASVVITGGTFVNWNPADNVTENPTYNYVAEGYTVVEETKANGDVWYTVVAE